MNDTVSIADSPLTGTGNPRAIMVRLVQEALRTVDADRCTLTSIDERVMRVETSSQRDGATPSFVGAEYPLDGVRRQPLLREAVTTGAIVTGEGFADTGEVAEPERADVARMHRVAVVPLSMGDQVTALLILSREESRDFEQTDLARLQQIGVMAVLALSSARSLEQLTAAQARALDALTRMSEHVASSEDQVSFFRRMTETVADLAGGERAAFWILRDRELVAQPSPGFTAEQLAGMHLAVTERGLPRLDRVLRKGEAVRFVSSEFGSDSPMHALVQLMGVRDGIAVPWRTAERPIGVLMAYDARAGWGDQEEWMIRLCARTSALVWQGYDAEHRAAELTSREVERLAEHAARIASLDEQKSEFLRLASHELRTPMTLVRGYLSMLEEGALGKLPPEATRVLPIMSSRMTQMGRLVEQMLAASRAQEMGLEPDLAEIRVPALVERVRSSLEGLLAPGQRMTITSQDGLVAVADSERTEVIVANLLANAIKYSPDGGDVEVRITRTGDVVRVAVTDHGVGIRSEDLAKLFLPFGRVQSAETEGIEGTGLGLYLSRRLARLQGGDIEVASQPGSGSTFTLVMSATRPGMHVAV